MTFLRWDWNLPNNIGTHPVHYVKNLFNLVFWDLQFYLCIFVRQCHTDALLKLLLLNGHPTLPKTCRTLMGSVKSILTPEMSGGVYYQFHVNDIVKYILSRYPKQYLDSVTKLVVHLNLDGLPVFRSTKTCLWPLLITVRNLVPNVVAPLVLWLGRSKPNNLNFLLESIEGLQSLMEENLEVEGKIYNVLVDAVVSSETAIFNQIL